MDLYQLEYVLAIARYQHFSNAADNICVSQSALSHQIAKLEEELGVRLFKRTTRTVDLTPAGKEFVEYASRIMAEITKARQAMRHHATAERGELFIGAIPTIGFLDIISAIASFQRTFPNISLNIHEDFSGRLLDMLLASEVDVALMTPPDNIPVPNVVFYPLISDDLVLTVHADHFLAAKKIISLSEAKDERYIFMKPNNGLSSVSLEACRNAGFEPNIVYQSNQIETVLGFVSAGLGVALMTSRVAQSLKKPSYVIVEIENTLKRVTSLAVLHQNCHSPVVSAFRSFMLEQLFPDKQKYLVK